MKRCAKTARAAEFDAPKKKQILTSFGMTVGGFVATVRFGYNRDPR
jgi:hypothetical protein